MSEGCIAVLDVGKTNAKLSLWTRDGRRLASVTRANAEDRNVGDYLALDTDGVAAWAADTLKGFAQQAPITAIVPIAHGASAAVISKGRLAAPPMSYETALPEDASYERARDDFAATGSPRLPNGLNLGAQLRRLEALSPDVFRDAQILPYPQYWAWLLSGVAASEESSLGCHTDLWRPHEQKFSDLAVKAGWAKHFAELRPASEVLGPISAEWAERTGLPRECVVYCGAHDSNAAFYGARAHPMLEGRDVTIISTGTWFVAMRAPMGGAVASAGLSEARDTLINVGVDGTLSPSARFMGGREMEMLIGAEDTPMRSPEFARETAPKHVRDVIASQSMILPTFALGVGPFPDSVGRWEGPELQGAARRAAAGMYLALVAEASLALIGARDSIVVEGRFADDLSFMRTLATLRSDCEIFVSRAEDGIACGALRLVNPDFKPEMALTKIEPLDMDVSAYAARWRALAAGVRA